MSQINPVLLAKALLMSAFLRRFSQTVLHAARKIAPRLRGRRTRRFGEQCVPLPFWPRRREKDAEQKEAKSAAQKAFVIARGWTGKRGLGSFAGTEADDERNLSANTTPSRSPRGPRAREKRSQLNEPQRPPSIMH